MRVICRSILSAFDELGENAMDVQVEHLGAIQFEIRARQHVIVSDQPLENGGYDEGATPPELFLAALGSCAAYYAVQYLRKKRLATEGTRVLVSANKVSNPVRLDDFLIQVESPVPLNEEQKLGVEEAVQHCLVHNTLLHPPKMRIEPRHSRHHPPSLRARIRRTFALPSSLHQWHRANCRDWRR